MIERKAGGLLDAEIAEKVMGWHQQTNLRIAWADRNGYFVHWKDGWNPSTDIAAAWQVLEKLQADGWTVTLAPRQFEKYPGDRFKFHGCRFVGTPQTMQSFSDYAETAPLAICLGSLAAVEAK